MSAMHSSSSKLSQPKTTTRTRPVMTPVTSQKIGDTSVPLPGFGCMGLSHGYSKSLSLEEAEPILLRALELGCTHWDTAVVYGAGINEELLGQFLKKHNARDKVFLASKCGFEVDFETRTGKGTVTNSAAHINEYIEGTIQRLQTTPDLYYLHRIDPNTKLEESIPALDGLRKSGKCKYIGLSECSAATLRKANSIAKIDALQAEYSPFFTGHESEGGLYETAKELGVAFVAYSPLGRGFLSGRFRSPDDFGPDDMRRSLPRFQGEFFQKNLEIVDRIKELADKKGCTPSQLVLQWGAQRGVLPIPGTTSVERLEENWGSREVDLSDEDMQDLAKLIEEAAPQGERYPEQHAKWVGN